MFFPDNSGAWCSYESNLKKFLMKNMQQRTIPPKQKRKETGCYICNGCGKLYKWQTSMLKHKRQECGKEPQFQCPYCPKRTKQKGNLMQHIKSMHNTEYSSSVITKY